MLVYNISAVKKKMPQKMKKLMDFSVRHIKTAGQARFRFLDITFLQW